MTTASLTLAEERGLSGLTLDSQVRKAFTQVPPMELAEAARQLEAESFNRSFVYLRDGQTEAIRAMLRPIGLMPDQLAYLHFVSLTLINALKRLPDLYIQDFNVRSVVPLTPPEEKWLWDNWGPSHRENNPVFGRLDAVIDFTSPMWKDSLHFMEPNLSGVGGIHLIPTCEQMMADIIMPRAQKYDPKLHLEPGQDLREMFIQEVLDHLDGIGRAGRNICFLEPKYSGDGPAEQAALAEYYRQLYGLSIFHADPTELYMHDKEVLYNGRVVDVIYRDYEIRDMLYIEEEEGVDIKPLRHLFKHNRVISSLAGDFDHKSCWEILTDPQFTQKYFSAEERQVFRRHVLWTRVLSDRRTSLLDGEMVDLLEYVRKDRDILVLKPNRSYGGDRVLIGPTLTDAEWEAAIEEAVRGGDAERDEEQWVVQRLTRIPVYEFPVLTDDGHMVMEPFYAVMGLAPTKYGLSILGRASQKMVVNVAQRGGLCAILIGKPTTRLFGPGATARLG